MTDDAGRADESGQAGGSEQTADPEQTEQVERVNETEQTTLPRCPRCNTPVARTTMIGPTDAIAGPCGCRVAPGIAKRSNSE